MSLLFSYIFVFILNFEKHPIQIHIRATSIPYSYPMTLYLYPYSFWKDVTDIRSISTRDGVALKQNLEKNYFIAIHSFYFLAKTRRLEDAHTRGGVLDATAFAAAPTCHCRAIGITAVALQMASLRRASRKLVALPSPWNARNLFGDLPRHGGLGLQMDTRSCIWRSGI